MFFLLGRRNASLPGFSTVHGSQVGQSDRLEDLRLRMDHTK